MLKVPTTDMEVTSVRLEKELKDKLKELAGDKGYQTLLRKVLWAFVHSQGGSNRTSGIISTVKDTKCELSGVEIAKGEDMLLAQTVYGELLQEFLQFREVTLPRQYEHELEQTQKRVHTLSGLLIALDNLDTTIEILRNAPDSTTAKAIFQTRLNISDTQADAILSMPMRRLTGMEKTNLQTEFQELTPRIEALNTLLLPLSLSASLEDGVAQQQ
jgi:hypothetical protein